MTSCHEFTRPRSWSGARKGYLDAFSGVQMWILLHAVSEGRCAFCRQAIVHDHNVWQQLDVGSQWQNGQSALERQAACSGVSQACTLSETKSRVANQLVAGRLSRCDPKRQSLQHPADITAISAGPGIIASACKDKVSLWHILMKIGAHQSLCK